VASIAVTTTISIWLGKFHNLRFPSIGTLHTLGVEAYGGDVKIEDETAYIDWGMIYPGELTNRSLYVRSKSNIETILKLETASWTFRDSDGEIVTGPPNSYMILSWNYTETSIRPSEVIPVTLTLSASSDISFINYLIANDVKDFSFDIVIVASG